MLEKKRDKSDILQLKEFFKKIHELMYPIHTVVGLIGGRHGPKNSARLSCSVFIK